MVGWGHEGSLERLGSPMFVLYKEAPFSGTTASITQVFGSGLDETDSNGSWPEWLYSPVGRLPHVTRSRHEFFLAGLLVHTCISLALLKLGATGVILRNLLGLVL